MKEDERERRRRKRRKTKCMMFSPFISLEVCFLAGYEKREKNKTNNGE